MVKLFLDTQIGVGQGETNSNFGKLPHSSLDFVTFWDGNRRGYQG